MDVFSKIVSYWAICKVKMMYLARGAWPMIIVSLFGLSARALDSGFALAWEQDTPEVSANNLIENTMQLWGFVDLLKVVAISAEDLDLIMTRCSGYIVELYVHLRNTSIDQKRNGDMYDCLTIFQSCCTELAQVEERYHKKCGLFCLLLLDMHKKLSQTNTATHNQH